ncbi:hypothetical protein MRX96_025306 [Rhipicephalus microplus]
MSRPSRKFEELPPSSRGPTEDATDEAASVATHSRLPLAQLLDPTEPLPPGVEPDEISSGLNTASSLPLSQVKWSSVTSPGTSGATPTPPSTSSRWQSAPSTSKSTEPKQPDRSSQSTSKSLSASKPPASTKEPEKAGLEDKSHSAANSRRGHRKRSPVRRKSRRSRSSSSGSSSSD